MQRASRASLRLGATLCIIMAACALAGCSHSIGGTASGLSGAGLVLQDDQGNTLAVNANGAFTFKKALANHSQYNVSVIGAPPGQTCTVNNSTGTISGTNVKNLFVVCSSKAYTVSGTVSGLAGRRLVLRNDGGDELDANDGPFAFPRPVANGAAYAVTVSAAPGQRCTVDGGTGQVRDANITGVAVNCSTLPPRLAFVANSYDDSVSTYTVDDNTGSLQYLSKAPAVKFPTSVAVTPSHRYAYAANYGASVVSQYAIGANGTLTPLSPATVPAGHGPGDIAIDPTGKYAYAANYGGTVSQYTIGDDGRLSSMDKPEVRAGEWATSVTVDPTGRYAYVANFTSNDVSQYIIGNDGSLTPMQPPSVAAGGTPTSVTVDSAGKHAYVSNRAGTITEYTVSANGSLKPLAIAWLSMNHWPYSLSIDPTGRYAYVANGTNNTVSQFTIGADGTLAPMDPPQLPAQTSPARVSADPSGKYVYVTNGVANTISQYAIGSGGALQPLLPPTAPAKSGPATIAIIQ